MNLIDIDKKIISEFAVKKSAAENLANENLRRARSIPAFAQLEILERETTFELGKEKFKNNNQINIDELTKTLSEIQDQKLQILQKLNLSLEDLQPKYSCKKCKDTGIFMGNTCNCFKKKRNDEIIKEYELSDNGQFSFENFDTSIFDKADLEASLKLKNLLEKWCNNFPNVKKKSIVLSGKTGVGKTFLSKCMARKLIEKNVSVCFVSAFEMNNMMLNFHTTFDSQKYQHLIPLLESDVLIIDDLGSEPLIKNVTVNYLFNVISERQDNQKATIITTNLSIDAIKNRYEDRICSRLSDKRLGTILNIQGSDLRIKK